MAKVEKDGIEKPVLEKEPVGGSFNPKLSEQNIQNRVSTPEKVSEVVSYLGLEASVSFIFTLPSQTLSDLWSALTFTF